MLADVTERWSSAEDMILKLWFVSDLRMVSDVFETCITIDLGWGVGGVYCCVFACISYNV